MFYFKSEKQTFKCADCDKTFFSQKRLLKHVQALHLQKKKQVSTKETNDKSMTDAEIKSDSSAELSRENIAQEEEVEMKDGNWIHF